MTVDLAHLQTTHLPKTVADMLWPEVDGIDQSYAVAVTPVKASPSDLTGQPRQEHAPARARETADNVSVHPRGLNWTDDAYANLIKRADKLRMAEWKSVHAKQPSPPLTAEEVDELARLDRATWWLQCKGAWR